MDCSDEPCVMRMMFIFSEASAVKRRAAVQLTPIIPLPCRVRRATLEMDVMPFTISGEGLCWVLM